MTKLFSPLVLAIATLSLAGCELYFGDSGSSDDRWSYCANDGYYVCEGDDCEWAGARCPDDPSYTCTSDAECAAGCYCSTDGICEEAGFCGTEEDCPDGFHCDVDRSSCVPDSCTSSAECEAGEYCDNGACTASCSCTTDAEAQGQGWGYCDEARNTCEPTPVGGSCAGTSTCGTAEPTCAAGQVALILNDCYTGACQDIAACDVAPTCEARQHEADCLDANATCTSVYVGINCTKADGSACQAGDTGCTCASFSFDRCQTRAANATRAVPTSDGRLVDMLSL